MELAHPNQINSGEAVANSGLKTTLNLVALFTIMAGALFKTMWWAGADILILLSTLALISTVVFMHKDLLRSGNDGTVTMLLSGLVALLVISAMFGRMHWAGAQVLIVAAIALTIITAVYLIFTRANVRLPKQFAITLLLYIMYVMGAVSGLMGRMQAMAEGQL